MDDIVEISPHLEAGVYADWLGTWFTKHQLTLDFGATTSEDALMVTTRVRVPVTAVLDVLHVLSEGIRDYELQFGEIRSPRRRDER